MRKEFIFPLTFLGTMLLIIFICSIYLCGCPGVAHAEQAQAEEPTTIAANPYIDEVEEDASPEPERWFGMTLPIGWQVGHTTGPEIRAFGPAGAVLWVRLTPNRRQVIWSLIYYVRNAEGLIYQRTRTGSADLSERADNPRAVVMEPEGCVTLEECDVPYTVSLNWPFADENALRSPEQLAFWLQSGIEVDRARIAAEAEEAEQE